MIFLFILASVATCAALFCVWGLICNERTYTQRRKLIDYVYEGPQWTTLALKFNAVTYNEHMWALVFFRDPRDLYSFDIPREVLK